VFENGDTQLSCRDLAKKKAKQALFLVKLAFLLNCSVFSLNFSSAGKGPFMASKAKNMHQRRIFLGRGGKGEVE